MNTTEGKFRVSASGYVKVTIDIAELFGEWRRWIDSEIAKHHKVNATHAAFCEWANDAISEDVTEKAAEDVWFEIESGPLAEDLLTADAFRALMDGDDAGDDAPPKPIKGQLDIFGGEVA